LRKTCTVWLIIIIYQVSACVGLSIASCCSYEPCHENGETNEQVHVHSRIHVALHILAHTCVSDDKEIADKHSCSCEGPHSSGPTQAPYVVDSQPTYQRLLSKHHLAMLSEQLTLQQALCPTNLLPFNGPRQVSLTRESILSVLLLI